MIIISIIIIAIGFFPLSIPILMNFVEDKTAGDLLTLILTLFLLAGTIFWFPLTVAQGISGILAAQKNSNIGTAKTSIVLGIIVLICNIVAITLLTVMFVKYKEEPSSIMTFIAASTAVLIIPNMIFLLISTSYMKSRKRQLEKPNRR